MLKIPSESLVYEGRTSLEEIESKLGIGSCLDFSADVMEDLLTKSKDEVKQQIDVILVLFNRMHDGMDITARKWWRCFNTGQDATGSSHSGSNLSKLLLQECGFIKGPTTSSESSETTLAEKKALSKHQNAFRPLRNKLRDQYENLEQKCRALCNTWDDDPSSRKVKMVDALTVAQSCYKLGLYIVMTLLPGRSFLNVL